MSMYSISKNDKEEMLKRIIYSLGVGTLALTKGAESSFLYHYTNIESLFNGIIVKNPLSSNAAISLWATDSNFLNDINEIRYGQTQVKELIKKKFDNEISKEIIQVYDDNVSRFIISFSKTKDSLPMWTTYGKGGDGISLGFDTLELLNNLAFVYPCFYRMSELKRFIKGFEKFIEDNSHFNTSFSFDTPTKTAFRDGYLHSLLSTLIKHPSFEYEQEVRFVCSKYQVKEIFYRYRNNMIIPYSQFFLPSSSLKKIIIGPTLDEERVKKSLMGYLDSKGFKHVDVEISTIPYRHI